MQLLLITTRWPYGEVTEFLDDEIHDLARAFDRVVVAPMRPRGQLSSGHPAQVVVDLSLAEHLDHTRLIPGRSARRLTLAVRAARPSGMGFGVTAAEIARDGRHVEWIAASLLNRADATSVAQWAAATAKPDIAYTFWLGAATVGLRKAWPNVPLVSRAHRSDLYAEAQGWESFPFQAASVRSVDLLAAVANHGAAYLAHRHPQAAAKIVVRRLGVPDLGLASDGGRDVQLRLLSASAIIPPKRVDRILDVAKAVAVSGVPVEWTHLGDGPGRADLERALADAPASLTVHLRGHVSLARVYEELRSGKHDIFVNLSVSEGAPVSLMEAQCVGMPVVATTVGGTPEVVPGTLNELVEPTDPLPRLCEAVLRAAARPAAEGQMRRDHWARNYDASVNYPSWAEELRRLAAGEAARRELPRVG